MRDRRLVWPVIVALVGIAFVLLVWQRDLAGFVSGERSLSEGTGGPPPVFAPVPIALERRDEVCARGIVFGARTDQVSFVAQGKEPTPRLRVTARGEGYEFTRTVPGRWVPNTTLTVPIDGPGRTLPGEVCVRNQGRRPVAILANGETSARLETSLNGDPVPTADLFVRLSRREPESLLDASGLLFDRVAQYSPIGAWAGWPIAILLVVGMPLAVFAALAGTIAGRARRSAADALPAGAAQPEDAEQERREDDLDADDDERRGEDG